jgi:hypothetical protein
MTNLIIKDLINQLQKLNPNYKVKIPASISYSLSNFLSITEDMDIEQIMFPVVKIQTDDDDHTIYLHYDVKDYLLYDLKYKNNQE